MRGASLLALFLCLMGCGSPAPQPTSKPSPHLAKPVASAVLEGQDWLDDGIFPEYDDVQGPSPAMIRYFWASKPDPKCNPGAFYPSGKVSLAFYQHFDDPHFKRFVACVTNEPGDHLRLAVPADFPKVGSCYRTRVKEVGYGVWIAFENGIEQTDYNASVQLARSRPGDPVRICVVSIPIGCPADDLRGIVYATHNLRTGYRWEMANTRHMCRGA